MGVMHDYFRAPGDSAVVDAMDRDEGGPPGSWADGVVDTKFLDPAVVVGQLIAFIRDVPFSTGVARSRLIWPADPDPEFLMEHQGPWVEALEDATRDTLAGAVDLPELAARWLRIEELDWPGASGDTLLPILTDLVALARDARAAGQHLYCWSSL